MKKTRKVKTQVEEVIKCSKCGRTLIVGYNMVFYNIKCVCGTWNNTEDRMRKKLKEANEKEKGE